MTKAQAKETPSLFKDDAAEKVKEIVAAKPPKKSDKTEVAVRATMTAVLNPTSLLELAVANNANIETLEKLMALQERYDAAQATKAFNNAIADAKAEIKPIKKNRRVKFEAKAGGKDTDYRHEDLAGIAASIDPILSKHGLGYRFETTSGANLPVTVTCILFHRDGHQEKNTLSAAVDTSGNKNHLQAIGSAQTYLQRYTLKAALGLAAASDDDGKAAGPPLGEGAGGDPGTITVDDNIPKITEKQDLELTDMIESCGVGRKTFLKFYAIEKLSHLPAERFAEAVAACKDYHERHKNDAKGKTK